jgi:hypothetical protein
MAKSSETMGQKKLDRLNPISYNAKDFMDQQARLRRSNEDHIPSSDNFDSNGDLSELDSFTILDSDPLKSLNVRAFSTPQNEENNQFFSQSHKSLHVRAFSTPQNEENILHVRAFSTPQNEEDDKFFSRSLNQENDSYNYLITPDISARRLGCMKPSHGDFEAQVTSQEEYSSVDYSPRRGVYNDDLLMYQDERHGTPFFNSNDEDPFPYHYPITPETAARQEVCLSRYDTESWSQKRMHGEENYAHTYPHSNLDLRVDSRLKRVDYERVPRGKVEAEKCIHSYAIDSASIQRESKKSFAAKLGSAAKLIGKKHHPTSKVRLPIKQHFAVNRSETRDMSDLRVSDTSTINKRQVSILRGIKNIAYRKPASKASSDESWISESDITDNDVICERGGKSNRHAGTKRYRGIVERLKTKYQNLTMKRDKTDLSREIIAQIQGSNGRFLKKDDDSGLYFVLSKVETTKKVSQALREKKTLKWTEDGDE